MANATLTNLSGLFKTQWAQELMQSNIQDKRQRPLLSLLQQAGRVKQHRLGSGIEYPVVYERPSTSATFTTAQSNSGPALQKKLNPTTVGNIFCPFQINKETQFRSKGKAAYMDIVRFSIEQHTAAISDDLERALFGKGDGVLTTVFGAATGTTLTVAPGGAYVIREGDELQFAATATGAVKTGTVTVTAVDYANDQVTVDALTAIDGTAGVANGDSIFREGTAPNGGALKELTGLDAWATANASLHGFDNTSHPRLRFVAVAGTVGDPITAIRNAQMEMERLSVGGQATAVFCPWDEWQTIHELLDGQDRTSPGALGQTGYNALRVVGPHGPLEVIGSKYCLPDTMFVVDPSSLLLIHITDKLIELEQFGESGAVLRDRDAADSYEGRMSCRAQLLCTIPSANAKISLS